MPGLPPSSRSRSVPAVARAVRLLHVLGDGRPEATLTELARRAGLHKSTAHGILATLATHRLVDRDPATRRYRLGPGLVTLARAALGADLRALARPHLTRLCRLSGETVTLHVPEGAGSVILASEESPHQLKVSAPVGHRLPLFAGAVAKVVWAFSPRRPRLPPRLPAYTSRSITDPAAYRRELDLVRRRGVAYDHMEYLPGVRALSVPVFRSTTGGARELVGVLTIVGVAARLTPGAARRLAGPLRRAAASLSDALGAQHGRRRL